MSTEAWLYSSLNFGISVMFVVISLLFLILFIWVFSLSLERLARGLSILLISLNGKLLVLIFYIAFVFSLLLNSAQTFTISFLPLTLGCCGFSFFSFLRCDVRLFIWDVYVSWDRLVVIYNLPSYYCFHCITEVSTCHVVILICFYISFDLTSYFFLDVLIL